MPRTYKRTSLLSRDNCPRCGKRYERISCLFRCQTCQINRPEDDFEYGKDRAGRPLDWGRVVPIIEE